MATDQINDECEQYLENLMGQKKEQWKKYTPYQRRYYLLYREFSRAAMGRNANTVEDQYLPRYGNP